MAAKKERLRAPALQQREAALLPEILRNLRGHPALTSWEESFCASVTRQIAEGFVLSAKQVTVLQAIRDKCGDGSAVAPADGDGEIIDDGAPLDDGEADDGRQHATDLGDPAGYGS
jgi:hypothetical protein